MGEAGKADRAVRRSTRAHRTVELRGRLNAARVAITPALFSQAAIATLPPPVQRYFRTVLTDGQPMIAAVHLAHEGTFNSATDRVRWKPFKSTQLVITQRPGFDWDARIRMAPGVAVRVHDAYVHGEGMLHAAVLGVFTVANARGTPEMARGELMRFLAEAVWYPTRLLPGHGLAWEAVDASTARATLRDGDVDASLDFHFDAQGLVHEVSAPARDRMVGRRLVPTPWRGRFWNYELRSAMRLPLDGEVEWVLPGGPLPYWRGHITSITFDFAPASGSRPASSTSSSS